MDEGGNVSVDETALWNALPAQLLHEAQLWVIEAMLWIDRPLSAVEIARVFEGACLAPPKGAMGLSAVAYHFHRLRRMGVITCVSSTQVRGAQKKSYRLRVPERVG